MSASKVDEDSLDDFVEQHLAETKHFARSNKVIHETLWGTNLFYSHEIALIDTSLFQRLREIHQTGLSYLTFPTAVHTRFDHSLGTLIQCSRFAEMVAKKYQDLLEERDILELRCAALIHDMGHCLFSHASEDIYALLPYISERKVTNSEFAGASPHEILTYEITNTNTFRSFFEKICDENSVNLDLNKIRAYIIGKSEPKYRYKSDFLNGPFDVDKIDYLFRDSHFSGIPINIDLDRLRYSTIIRGTPDEMDERRLVVSHTGTTPLEQILFSRMQLYPTLYNHQKVRAADCMFKGIIEHIRNRRDDGLLIGRKDTITFDNIIDFLWASEHNLFEATFPIGYTAPKQKSFACNFQFDRLDYLYNSKELQAIRLYLNILAEREYVQLISPVEFIDKTRSISKAKYKSLQYELFKYVDIDKVDKDSGLIKGYHEDVLINLPSRARQVMRTNDVLLPSPIGSTKGIVIVSDEYDSQLCSTGFIQLKSSSYEESLLLFAILKSKIIQRYLYCLQSGCIQPSVAIKTFLNDFLFPLPIGKYKNELLARIREYTDLSQRLYLKISDMKQDLVKQVNSDISTLLKTSTNN